MIPGVILVHDLAFIAGLALVVGSLQSAIKTFVLPRGARDVLTRVAFHSMRGLFDLWLRGKTEYEARDRVMAFYAPLALLWLLAIWIVLVMIGFAAMFWSAGGVTPYEALRESGSSLLTLGFVAPATPFQAVLVFAEAAIGLMLVALLIAYLPTIYAAFARREAAVKLLEVRAGNPPSAMEMILRFQRIHGLAQLGEQWAAWEDWFADIDESHTSLSALVFFRSPLSRHSWITSAGAVLDAAALSRSTLDIESDPRADLCIRAGYLALRNIADFFGVSYVADPHYPQDQISVTRPEFDEVYARLAGQGVPVKADCEQAWRDFAGWRVNYDSVLVALCNLTMAPSAPWSSDRAECRHPRLPWARHRRPPTTSAGRHA